jgi:cytochrome d ubiquinol oxidase subunit I
MSGAETALLLARWQFAFTISFHFIFPALTIGLASYLAVLEGLWLKTGQERYLTLFRYWIKIFSINFAMGVVSGIVMSYQFGTNWAVFSDKAGPVIGPLMAYEVLSAFFLEAGFLGVMLFGMNKVGKGLHYFATLMVAAGTLMSAFWIISANSWMHTPTGYAMNAQGQFVPGGSWFAIIFNPSFPYRLVHTVIASYLTTALLVGGVGAWHLLKERRARQHATPSDESGFAGSRPAVTSPRFAPQNEAVRTMFSMAMWMAAIVAPIQVLAGDMHGLNTQEHQPQKVMAMEGHFDSYPHGAPLILFGIPDSKAETVHGAVGIPHLSSLILHHSWNAPVHGLKTIPKDERPPVGIVFWSFRIMVGLGLLMVALGLCSLWARYRGRLYEWPLLHRFALAMAPAGFVAVIAGWVTTEVGRQPYVVYHLLRTEDAVAPIGAAGVAGSLLAFVIVYLAVFGVGIWYLLRLMSQAPHTGESEPLEAPIRTAGITPSASVERHHDGDPHSKDADEEAR